jgi:hypothetical protein
MIWQMILQFLKSRDKKADDFAPTELENNYLQPTARLELSVRTFPVPLVPLWARFTRP